MHTLCEGGDLSCRPRIWILDLVDFGPRPAIEVLISGSDKTEGYMHDRPSDRQNKKYLFG